MNVNSKKMNRNQISICVNPGSYVLNCMWVKGVKKFRCNIQKCKQRAEKSYEKYQFLDVVALMESFQIVKPHGYDVVGVVQEAQMQHSKFFAGISFAQQMSRPFR